MSPVHWEKNSSIISQKNVELKWGVRKALLGYEVLQYGAGLIEVALAKIHIKISAYTLHIHLEVSLRNEGDLSVHLSVFPETINYR